MSNSWSLGGGALAMVLTAAAGTPVSAQGSRPSAPLDPAPCREMLANMALVPPAAKAETTVTRPDQQTCRFAPLSVQVGPFVGWAIDSLTTQGLIQAASGAAAPQTVRVQARGVRIAPPRANPTTAYIMKVGSIPFDVDLDYVSDPGAKLFTLEQFSMRGEAIGLFEVKAALTGIAVPVNPFATPQGPAMPDTSTLGLRSLSVHLENHGFIERMVTPAVAGYVVSSSGGADPEPVINARKLAIAAMLRAMLPAYGTTPETADALSRFVSDFPHPSGSLQCSLAADPPLRMPADGASPDQAAIKAMVSASHPTCTYVRS